MKYRYFKGDLTCEPLKSIYQDCKRSQEKRKAEISSFLAKYPFNNGLIKTGGLNSIFVEGIACNAPLPDEVKSNKGFKIKSFNENCFIIRANKRYKTGKVLADDLKKLNEIYERYPEFSIAILKSLNFSYRVIDWRNVSTEVYCYMSVAGVSNKDETVLLVKTPYPISEQLLKNNKPFPAIPACLTEIKESDFLSMQGE